MVVLVVVVVVVLKCFPCIMVKAMEKFPYTTPGRPRVMGL